MLAENRSGDRGLEGLHRAIAEQLIEKPAPLIGKKFKFLPVEMDFSQKALGQLLGVTDQAVAKWEKDQTKSVPGSADTLVQLLPREKVLKRERPIFNFIQVLAKLDQYNDNVSIQLTITEQGWPPHL